MGRLAGGFRPWRSAWADALYGAGGFYRRDEGPRGHFETSANAPGGVVELLAQALLRLAAEHGCRTVVDVGAGRGELLRAMALVATTEVQLIGVDVVRRPTGLPEQVTWLTSPGGAELPGELSSELAGLSGAFVLAHEWLDVVPCDVVEVDGSGRPRLVEVAGDGTERLGPLLEGEPLRWCERWWPLDRAEPGTRAEIGLTRDRAWAGLAERVRDGLLLAVDYGHRAGERPPAGTLAAHRAGRLVPPVPDGSCDLTAHVAWDSLRAPAASAVPSPPAALTTQRAALRELGVDATRPGRSDSEGGPAYLAGLQRAGAAATLLDPGGLGGLGWWLQPVATGQADPAPARVEP